MNTERFDLALDLLQAGLRFKFSNVEFHLDASLNRLDVGTITSWQIGNLSAEIALAEIQRGMDAFEHLSTDHRFSDVVKGKDVRYSVLQDLGNMVVEICHLSGNRIVWS